MKKRFLKITAIMVVVAGSFYSCKESDILTDAVPFEYGATTRASGSGLFRYLDGERYYLEISPDKVIVKFNREMTEDALESSFRGDASLPVSDISAMNGNEFKLMRFDDNNRSSVSELTTQLMSNDAILFVGYVIVDEIGKTSALTNQINVKLRNDNDSPILQEAIASFDISEVRQLEFNSRRYLLTVNCVSGKNVLQIANELHRTGLFEWASPNLLLFIRYATNDTHFSQQWGLRNTGQSGGTAGIDIRAQQAWTITTGSPNIRIAILDSGTDLNHPDLRDNLIPGLGFDATGGNNGGNHSENPHGTAVAGIAAARGNNGRGVAGVAHNSLILPIHMGDAPFAYRVEAGIYWSIENDARVINMSFTTTNTPEVRDALDAATAANIVLVAASGNHNGAVSFPASRPDVIAVGAIDRCGIRSGRRDIIPNSCDPWPSNSQPGSAFGTNLDVVAPGTNIFTTGVLGFTGYGTVINNGVNGVYFSGFSGTSAAAPHVAGIAALMLSVNPTLTAQQVRNTIKSTANRNLPGVTFTTTPGRPNGTWNNQVGHGLVDAYAAVREAVGLNPNISGPTTICGANTAATFTLQNIPPNTTIQWIVDTPLDIVGFNNLGRVVVRHQGWFATPATTSRIRAAIIFNGQVVHTVVREVVVNRPTVTSIVPITDILQTAMQLSFTAHHNGESLTWSVSPNTGVHMDMGPVDKVFNTQRIGFVYPGDYTISVTSTNACGSYTRHLNITVVENHSFPPWLLCPECRMILCICFGWGRSEEEMEEII